MDQISLLFCIGVNRKCPLWLMFFGNIDSGAAVRIKCDLNANEFFSASARVSDVMWTSVWSGNLLSSEVISLTHCIVKWGGGQSNKNGVTWTRFVRAASVFCLVSWQKWSVLFLCLIYQGRRKQIISGGGTNL